MLKDKIPSGSTLRQLTICEETDVCFICLIPPLHLISWPDSSGGSRPGTEGEDEDLLHSVLGMEEDDDDDDDEYLTADGKFEEDVHPLCQSPRSDKSAYLRRHSSSRHQKRRGKSTPSPVEDALMLSPNTQRLPRIIRTR